MAKRRPTKGRTKRSAPRLPFHLPVRSEPLAQMATTAVAETLTTPITSAHTWEDTGLTTVVSLTQRGSITALAVAECVPYSHLVDMVIGGRVMTGLMKFRIRVDNQIANPQGAYVRGITSTAFRETRSFAATIEGLSAGRHTVNLEWLNEPASAGGASPAELGARTLTVWTTAIPVSRPGGGSPNVP
jgi:hypothetical protein